ncbi:hypothetical protein B0H21DRAFT_52252 [Amylocystis lapponica]|nr:hypothetical protein B0H21DRAFT_52252 [Amylocystis lapponica]
MAAVRVRRLTDPTPEQLDAVGSVGLAAFEHDKSCYVLVDGDIAKAFFYFRAQAAAAVIGGELWVASHGELDIAGFAIWFPPDHDFLDTPEQAEAGWNQLMASYSPEHRKWLAEYLGPMWRAQCIAAVGQGFTKASYYLASLATHPDHQRRGVGKALFDAVAKKATAEQKHLAFGCTLEANAMLYRSWGCVTRGPWQEVVGNVGSFSSILITKEP